MMQSCMGHILEVNLTTGEIKKTRLPERLYDMVLTGKGLGAWYCLRNIPAGADPLGPDNIIGFCSGALTGTGALLSGRFTLVGKSPLTDGWGDANCGGMFAPAIKQCGVDAIFFKGISPTPVYLYMDNTTCELRDAAPYWGLDATEAEERLMRDNRKRKLPRVALIGQAGEKLSRISGVCNDKGRIAARSGLGAVMGSKRLKAVVLAGTKPIPCADPERVKKLSADLGRKVKRANLPPVARGYIMALTGKFMGTVPLTFPMDGSMLNMMYRRWGTPMFELLGITSGDAPIKNWAGSVKDVPGFMKEWNPDKVIEIEDSKYHCYSCPLGCGGMLNTAKLNNGAYSHTHKPEYESMNQLGPLILNMSRDSIYQLNEMLNRAGMDTISAGGTIAFAVEAYENGLISKEDTGGLELTWGNTDAIIELARRMIDREGFGDILADGSKRAAKRIGRGSEQYAMHIGGAEPPAHDSRNDPMLALNYAAEPAPGKHTVAMSLMYSAMSLCDICSWAPPVKLHNKAEDFLPTEDVAMANCANVCYTMLADSSGVCYYGEMMGVHTYKLIDYLNAAGGWSKTGDEYMEIGRRVQTLRQQFNIKQGIDPRKVRLPKRMLGYPPLKAGALKGVQVTHAEEQIKEHWKSFGWDENTGAPLQSTLDGLGITELLDLEV